MTMNDYMIVECAPNGYQYPVFTGDIDECCEWMDQHCEKRPGIMSPSFDFNKEYIYQIQTL